MTRYPSFISDDYLAALKWFGRNRGAMSAFGVCPAFREVPLTRLRATKVGYDRSKYRLSLEVMDD